MLGAWALHADRLEEVAEVLGEQRVAVVHEVALPGHEAIDAVREVSRDLLHPGAVRLAHDAGDLDAARLDVDDEEDEVANEPR